MVFKELGSILVEELVNLAKMDLKSLAEHLDQMPMFPYFTLSHIIVCTLTARADLGIGSLYFSRKHPLACWLSTILCVFSSTILANFLLNEPVISALGNTQQVLWATAIWYLIFYSPFDLVYKICNFMPFKILIYSMNEIHNCKAIYHGILHSSKIFPDSYVIMALIGIVKGNGPGFTRLLERLVRGSWSMGVLEFMNPSYTTKISTFATIIFILNRESEWLMISQSFVFFCVVCACIYFRLSSILLDLTDPFSPFENLICLLLFGGIWDALARAIAIDDSQSAASHHYSRSTSQIRPKTSKVDIVSRAGNLNSDKAILAGS